MLRYGCIMRAAEDAHNDALRVPEHESQNDGTDVSQFAGSVVIIYRRMSVRGCPLQAVPNPWRDRSLPGTGAITAGQGGISP